MAVYLDLEPGDSVRIGADTVIRLVQKSGRRAKLRIETEYRVKHERVDDMPRPSATPVSTEIRRPTPARRGD
jgi:hypothetical protein